jgi:hypothetical protein
MPTPKVNSWLGWRIFTINNSRRTRAGFHAGSGLKGKRAWRRAYLVPVVRPLVRRTTHALLRRARHHAWGARAEHRAPGAERGRRRARLCSHSVALPLLLVLLNTPSSSLVHLAAPASTRTSRSGCSRPAPPPAPDDTAPGPTSAPNRPVQVRKGFQAGSRADSGSEPPLVSSSSPARTTLLWFRSF